LTAVNSIPALQEVAAEERGNRMAKIEALAARRHSGFVVVLEDPYDEGK
jgi:hypothetical protein